MLRGQPVHLFYAKFHDLQGFLHAGGQIRTLSSWSARTMATIASTMGTARGTTQGSCRPRAMRSTSTPSRLTVFCFWPIVDVGLNATRIVIISPAVA